MADGELTLKLDDDTARRLQEAADAAGRPVADYAVELIADGLADGWAEALEAFQEFDRTGEDYDAATVMDEFCANVAARTTKA
jgi:predicted transcriptional regulator